MHLPVSVNVPKTKRLHNIQFSYFPQHLQVFIMFTTVIVCQQPSDSGRNCAEGKLEIKWYYNSGTERCDRFWYRGCGGNSNNFNTKEECQQTCTHDNGKPGT